MNTEDELIEALKYKRRGDGFTYWVDKDGKAHREGKPAVVHDNGGEEWYRHGEMHRIGGPAVSWGNGTEEWYQDGLLHRTDGPAYTHSTSGVSYWFINGVRQPHLEVEDEHRRRTIRDTEVKATRRWFYLLGE